MIPAAGSNPFPVDSAPPPASAPAAERNHMRHFIRESLRNASAVSMPSSLSGERVLHIRVDHGTHQQDYVITYNQANGDISELNPIEEGLDPATSPPEPKEEGQDKNVEPMPPADPKEVSKEKLDELVRIIAKDIPQKFIKILMVKPLPSSEKPDLPSKDDKTADVRDQKDPTNSTLAIPKEAVKASADQASYQKNPAEPFFAQITNNEQVIQEQDIAENESIPVQNEMAEAFSALDQEIHPDKFFATPAASASVSAKNPEMLERNQVLPHVKFHSEISQNPWIPNSDSSLSPTAQPQTLPMGNVNLEQDESFFIKDLSLPIQDPISKGMATQLKQPHWHPTRTDEIQSTKTIKPRQDVAIEKNDNPNQSVVKPHEDRHIHRLPISPEMPFTREGVLRNAGHSQSARLRQDDGFRLNDLALMVLSAVICGAKNSIEITQFLQAKERFFSAWMGFKNGIPPFRMIWWLVNRLDPSQLMHFLKQPHQNIHVWESNRGLVLGEWNSTQRTISSEALFSTLDLFDLTRTVIHVEEPILKRATAREIKRKGGEYVMSLKGKHGSVYERGLEFFECTLKENSEISVDRFHDTIQEEGRIEIREVVRTDNLEWFEEKEEWSFLKSAIKMKSEICQKNRTLSETRMYLTSLSHSARDLAQTLRSLTVIEGRVDWLADCDFAFHGTLGLVEHEKRNLDLLRQASDQLLQSDDLANGSPETKRKKAFADHTYLRHLLQSFIPASS
jgi:DDE_Tnp_1-associated